MESHDFVGKNNSLYFKLLAVLWLPENDIRGGNERGMMRFKFKVPNRMSQDLVTWVVIAS